MSRYVPLKWHRSPGIHQPHPEEDSIRTAWTGRAYHGHYVITRHFKPAWMRRRPMVSLHYYSDSLETKDTWLSCGGLGATVENAKKAARDHHDSLLRQGLYEGL